MSEDFEVGVSIVVVPNGLTEDGSFAVLSLSFAPVDSKAPEAVDSVDIRWWPEAIGQKKIRIHISDTEFTKVSSVNCIVDSSQTRTDQAATELWRDQIFKKDIAQSGELIDLKHGLVDDTKKAATQTTATSPEKAEVGRLIDKLYGAFIATNLTHRVADSSRSNGRSR